MGRLGVFLMALRRLSFGFISLFVRNVESKKSVIRG